MEADYITSAVLLSPENQVLGQMRFAPGDRKAVPVNISGFCYRALIKWKSGHETNFQVKQQVAKGDEINFEQTSTH